MSADCCSYGCTQGPGCSAHKATPGTRYCDKSRQVCATPYTCSTACRLIADPVNSTSVRQASSVRPTLTWFVVLVASTALAAIAVLQAARIFY